MREQVIKSLIKRATSDGTFQRAKIYSSNYSGDKHSRIRSHFRSYLFEELDQHMPVIIQNNDDKIHYTLIEEFCNKISNSKYNELLVQDLFRTGTGQKLINLYWKMSWLLLPDYPTPIHCPFDSIIIQKLDKSVRNIRWTSFNDYETYQRLVDAAKKTIKNQGYKTIAEWELKIYYDSV